MEVRMNEGRTASRSWETGQDPQTLSNQDEHLDNGQYPGNGSQDPRTLSQQDGHPDKGQYPGNECQDLADTHEE